MFSLFRPSHFFAGLLLLAFNLIAAPQAFAHAVLLDSSPRNDALIQSMPKQLRLQFNEPVTPVVARLLGPDGEATDLKESTEAAPELTFSLPSLTTIGSYTFSWRVVSADGHPVGGTLHFSLLNKKQQSLCGPRS